MIVKIKKRGGSNHNGTVTVDANFVDDKGSYSHAFVCPIDVTEEDICIQIKTWLEQKESGEVEPFGEMTEVDLDVVSTDWIDRQDYEKEKAELTEMMELVTLGAMDSNDQEVKDKQVKVKSKHKDGYKKEK